MNSECSAMVWFVDDGRMNAGQGQLFKLWLFVRLAIVSPVLYAGGSLGWWMVFVTNQGYAL